MAWQQTPYVTVLFASAAVCFLLVGYAILYTYRYEVDRTVVAFGVLLAGMGVYSLARGMQLGHTTRAGKLRWARLLYIGFAPGVVAWFVFAIDYSGYRQRLGRRALLALGAWAGAVVVAGLTNHYHELLWSVDPEETVLVGDGLVTLDRAFGPLFFVVVLVGYLLFAVGIILLLRTAIGNKSLFQGQALAVGIGAIIPVVTALPFLFGATPGSVDLTPVGFAFAGIAYAYAIFRHRFLDVRPVARNAVVTHMRDGFVVLDRRNRIVDFNPAATRFLGTEDLLGERLDELLPVDRDGDGSPTDAGTDEPPLEPADGAAAAAPDRGRSADAESGPPDGFVGTVETGDGRYLEIDRSPIGERDPLPAELVMLRDVTERERRKRDRQRRSERLERFAGVVSHDLRSPLNVAAGRLELARDDVESDHLDHVADSLDRMETIVDDTLALARQGQTVADPEPVDVDAVARRAWSNVETGGATLEIEATTRIRADPGRLQRVFENLFRNGIEHGTPDRSYAEPSPGAAATDGSPSPAATDGDEEHLTVRVGRLPDGFYVEDDGPGVDPSIRDELFQLGTTTSAEGTGFGLAIVEDIVTAHGWTIAATAGADGGARFEVTGVEPIDDSH